MSYTVRFESNATSTDALIASTVDKLLTLSQSVKDIPGASLTEDQAKKFARLRNVCKRTLDRTMDWADQDFDQQITTSQWDWKGNDVFTRRRNGQVVSEPRDIVDTKTLLNSKQRINVDADTEDFTWEAGYAEKVHDGYTAKNGSAYPARPWTEKTLDIVDDAVDSIFALETL